MPNNIIMADAKGPTDILTGSATVSTDKKITIPLEPDKKNFAVFPDYSDEETPSSLGAVVSCLFRLDYLSDTRCYYAKTTSWGTPPTQAIGTMPTSFVVETSNSITMTCSNGNPTGLLVPGKTARYFVW